jgi:predicted porin
MRGFVLMVFFALPVEQAFSQSSVTLYGVIDAGLTYANNSGGHSVYQMEDSEIGGDRWGLLGLEDLGGGIKAIFQLENGFSVFTGKYQQGGDEFGRQAYVGLRDANYGTLTLGRQYDSYVSFIQPTTMNGGGWGCSFLMRTTLTTQTMRSASITWLNMSAQTIAVS